AAGRSWPLRPRAWGPRSCGRRLDGLCLGRIDEHAEPDREAVPSVDDVDHERQLDLLLQGEVGLQRLVGALPVVAFAEPRQCLGPGERGALAIAIARGLAPRRQQVD